MKLGAIHSAAGFAACVKCKSKCGLGEPTFGAIIVLHLDAVVGVKTGAVWDSQRIGADSIVV